MIRFEEFINVMEKYSYFSMDNKFTSIEILDFLNLMSLYNDYLSEYDSSASILSIGSTIKILIKTIDEFDITHIEYSYHVLIDEYQNISQNIDSSIKSFGEFCLPTIRDIKLKQLIG